jgi:hypothetical protein
LITRCASGFAMDRAQGCGVVRGYSSDPHHSLFGSDDYYLFLLYVFTV